MDISANNQIPTQLVNRVSGASHQQPVKKVESSLEKDLAKNLEHNKAQQDKSVERFDVDQQGLALVEQEYLSAQNNQQKNQQTENSSTRYDNHVELNQTAISAYQSVDNIARKESIKQLFGVDLYA